MERHGVNGVLQCVLPQFSSRPMLLAAPVDAHPMKLETSIFSFQGELRDELL
jgi:hypothetical protein